MKNNKVRQLTRNILLGAITMATILTSSALPAFAEEETTTTLGSFKKNITLELPQDGTASDYQSPAETFTFSSGKADAKSSEKNMASLAAISHTRWNTGDNYGKILELNDTSLNNSLKTIKESAPATINIGTAVYSPSDETTTTTVSGNTSGTSVDVPVTINSTDSFKNPGVYYYDFHEIAENTAGVTYDGNTYRIAVTVKKDKSGYVPDKIALIKEDNTDVTIKSAGVTNKYSAGKLIIKKTVAGTMGDDNKEFTIHLKLTAPEGKKVKSTISVSSLNPNINNNAIVPNDWQNSTVTKDFTVKNGTEITLKNIPDGVKWYVKEDSYTGYTTTYKLNGGDEYPNPKEENAIEVAHDTSTVEIINTNDTKIDTGIFTSNLPYILILVAAAAGAIVYVVSRRRRHA